MTKTIHDTDTVECTCTSCHYQRKHPQIPTRVHTNDAADNVRSTLLELRECLMAHEAAVRVLGNVTAGDALHAIDTILALAERYAAIRTNGCHPSMVIADVRLGPASFAHGADLDRYTDSLRARVKVPCPRGFWCVHEVLCAGARRVGS